MRIRAWIPLLGFTVGVLPAGKTLAQVIAIGPTSPAHATVTNPARAAIAPHQEPAAVSPETKRQALEAYGKLPLAFVPNAGQANANIRIYGQGSGFRFGFLRGEALFAFTKMAAGKARGAAITLRFLGARPEAEPQGRYPGKGRVNYLLGNDPTEWRTDLPSYENVVYPDLWPGIDLVFRGADGQLKYEFVLRPGAKIADIRLAYRGTEGLSLDPEGNLLVNTPLGTLTDARPLAYQELGGERVPVASRYRLGNGGRYGFAIGAYDRSRPMVIDPGLAYSTYLGGSNFEEGRGIAVDSAGNAYITGRTGSPDFPATSGAFQTANAGINDVFVTKLNAAGTTLVYSTYLGGVDDDGGLAIAVDSAHAAYVTGFTDSPDFPTTPGAFQPANPAHSGSLVRDAFVTKLNAAGSTLIYSTYLGGSSADQGSGIAVDHARNAYVTGFTFSPDFPTTPGAIQPAKAGLPLTSDAFVARLNTNVAGAASLVYSTYLGGSSTDRGFAIAVDSARNAYVTGDASSLDFPTTPGAFQPTNAGIFSDAFVSRLNTKAAGAESLVYSTYLGGNGFNDQGRGIVVDSKRNAYVTGITDSLDFPTTAGALDTTFNGARDAFVTKLNPRGSALVYSTYLGGVSFDFGFGIAIDSAGNAYVTGDTDSLDFPTTPGAFDTTFNGSVDVFVTKLNAAGSALAYSTYLGGSINDQGRGIAVDSARNAYVTGQTGSPEFPTTPSAFDTTYDGNQDAFATKLHLAPACPANEDEDGGTEDECQNNSDGDGTEGENERL